VNPYSKRISTENDDRYIIKRTRKRQKSDVEDKLVELVAGVPVDLAPAVSPEDCDWMAGALNKRHTKIFCQQMRLLDDYGANMAQHQAAIVQNNGAIQQALPPY
jgi:hypothetical protein